MAFWNRKTAQQPVQETKSITMSTGTEFPAASYSDNNPYDDKASPKEAYRTNPVVKRCVSELAGGLASVPIKVYSGDDEIDQYDHALVRLMRRANPQQSMSEFIHALVANLQVYGNAYALKVELGVQNKETELVLLRPDLVTIVPGPDNRPRAYKYKPGKGDPIIYEVEDGLIKHFRTYNPDDEFVGLSPIAHIWQAVQLHNSVVNHNNAMLANGGSPLTVYTLSRMDPTTKAPIPAPADVLEDFKNQLNNGRAAGGGSNVVVDGTTEVKVIGLSPKEMEFSGVLDAAARMICMGYGVPPQVAGLPDSQTYNNVEQSLLGLFQNGVKPIGRRVEADFNEWIVPSFVNERSEANINLRFDYSQAAAMTEFKKSLSERMIAELNVGAITRNEYRDRIDDGYDDLDEGGDTALIGTVPLEELAQPAPAEDDDAPSDPSS